VLLLLLSLFPLAPAGAQQREPKLDPQGELRRFDSVYQKGIERRETETSQEDVVGRDEWFYFQRRYPYDMIPEGVRQDAVRQVRGIEQRIAAARAESRKRGAEVQATSTWQQVGPGNVAGRIKAIAVNPADPTTVYIGAAAGGVWKCSDPNGNVWTTSFDKQSAIAVNALAVDPSDTSTIYAGTGEIFGPNSLPSASPAYLGDGIFKSTDAGASWKNIGLNNVGAVSKIYVSPAHGNIVYATATIAAPGFYRSSDGGSSWSNFGFPAAGGTYAYDLSVNRQNDRTIYVSTNRDVYKSTDGGVSFKSIKGSIINTSAYRISVAVAPSDSNRVYVLVARTGAPNGKDFADVYKSTNGGTSWQNVTPGQSDSPFVTGAFFNNQGYYDQCLAVDPVNPDVCFAGGIDVYRTIDGGGDWTNVTLSYLRQPSDPSYVHPDQHILAIAESGVAYLGNDGGLFLTVTNGDTWTRQSRNLPISQFYALDVDPTNQYRVYGGTQDNGSIGSLKANGAFGSAWDAINGGDGFHTVVDLTDSTYVYSEVYYAAVARTRTSSPSVPTRIDGAIAGDAGQWSSPLAMSPADKTTLYSGRRSLWRTSNPRSPGNPAWTQLSPGNGNFISAIGLSPFDAGKMMVGSASGELRYSTNNGANWAGSSGVPGRYITSIVYDPVKDGRVYVTVSGTDQKHVYRSENNGANFVDVSGNLPQGIPTNTIAIDPADNSHLFIGTDVGAFVSLDGGASWFPFNDGLPYAPVMMMKAHRASRMLYAGTHGRSAFRVSMDNIQVEPLLLAPLGGETFSSPGEITVRWGGFSCPVRVLLSFDGGQSYPIVVDNVTGTSATLDVPLVKTTQAVVKVESTCDDRKLQSGNFTINATPNISNLGALGLKNQALAVRKNTLWLTQRGSDTIYRFAVPGLAASSKSVVVRTGIPGTVRDRAYDAAADRFYALVTDDDFSNAKLYGMDTNGVATGQITLPAGTFSGIAMAPSGVALITPGPDGVLYVIDPSNGNVVSQSTTLKGEVGTQRFSLEWDGLGFVQGVSDIPGVDFPTELQRLKGTDTLRMVQRSPVILPSGKGLAYFGLAFNPDPADRSYYITDTAGIVYRIGVPFSGVKEIPTGISRLSEASISGVTPNPVRGSGNVQFTLKSRQHVILELYTTDGARVGQLMEGDFEPGAHNASFVADLLASGIYYVSLTTASGERNIAPVVLMK
jgi:hypothetical protein